MIRFEGSWTALATPFTKAGALDEAAYLRLIRLQISGGSSGLVPCGSTGEAATLSASEYRRAVTLAVRESGGRLPVMAGVATNDTAKAVALAREAAGLGVDALLLLSPYYNKPTQEGLYRHFKTVCGAVTLPVMAYNIPGRTAVNMAPATLLRLAKDCANLLAVKEASGSLDQVSELVARAPRGFSVLSGDDSLTLPMMAVGARGVVSVVSNAAPRLTAALCAAAAAGDFRKARGLHTRLFPLVKALFIETNPIPIKAALEMMGLCRGQPRLPLTPLSPGLRPGLRSELKTLGLV